MGGMFVINPKLDALFTKAVCQDVTRIEVRRIDIARLQNQLNLVAPVINEWVGLAESVEGVGTQIDKVKRRTLHFDCGTILLQSSYLTKLHLEAIASGDGEGDGIFAGANQG